MVQGAPMQAPRNDPMTPRTTRRTLLKAGLACPALALPAWSGRRPYVIDKSSATIQFLFDLNGIIQTGTAPLQRADVSFDPQNLTSAEADVTADLTQARTGFIFATSAMKSASVLDTERHPTARFRSTQVILGRNGRISEGAVLEGTLTLRGMTRPVRFDAALFRPPGSAASDLERLDIHLTGAIQRFDYGAMGYADLVADRVGLDIRARISAL